MSNYAWAVIENIVLISVAGLLAWYWDSGWPFLLMLFCNSGVRKA